MGVIKHEGKRGTTYGFKFVYRGRRIRVRGFPTKSLAKTAEDRERQRLAKADFETRWGPLAPQLTKWEDVVKRYAEAKADKLDLLEHDVPRLRWWATFFADDGIHYLQAVTPDAIDRGKTALRTLRKKPATVQRYLAVLRHCCQLAVRRWQLLDRNPVFAVDWPRADPYHARILTRAASASWRRPSPASSRSSWSASTPASGRAPSSASRLTTTATTRRSSASCRRAAAPSSSR